MYVFRCLLNSMSDNSVDLVIDIFNTIYVFKSMSNTLFADNVHHSVAVTATQHEGINTVPFAVEFPSRR